MNSIANIYIATSTVYIYMLGNRIGCFVDDVDDGTSDDDYEHICEHIFEHVDD